MSKTTVCRNCGLFRTILRDDGGCLRKMNCGRTTAPVALDALINEVDRLQATDAACGEIHLICSDAGIGPGHVVDRVRQLQDRHSRALVLLKRTIDALDAEIAGDHYLNTDGQLQREVAAFLAAEPAKVGK